MATILVHIALLAYAAGAAAFLTWLVRPDRRWVSAGRALLLAGVAVHFAAFAAGLGVAALGLGAGVWKSGQLFRLLAAVTVGGYLLLAWRYDLPVAGAFRGPLNLLGVGPARPGTAQERAASARTHTTA